MKTYITCNPDYLAIFQFSLAKSKWGRALKQIEQPLQLTGRPAHRCVRRTITCQWATGAVGVLKGKVAVSFYE